MSISDQIIIFIRVIYLYFIYEHTVEMSIALKSIIPCLPSILNEIPRICLRLRLPSACCLQEN